MGRSRARKHESSAQRTTSADVAGIDEASGELREVVDFVKHPERLDLLVVGSHQHRRVGRLVQGSTSERRAGALACSLLVVPPVTTDRQTARPQAGVAERPRLARGRHP
jgi:hypothetical protein